MNNCPKCGATLNNDEKASGRCFACGHTFTSSLPQAPASYRSEKNTVGTILRWVGIVILVLGTLGSFLLAQPGAFSSSFDLGKFLVFELSTAVVGMLMIGLSEIIQLLDSIKNGRRM